MDGKLVLTTEKTIAGKICKPGTLIAEIQCVGKFTIDDVNRAMQLNQIGVVAVRQDPPASNGKPGK